MFFPTTLALTFLLQASVVLAVYNAPCQYDSNCDAGEMCLTVERDKKTVSTHCLKFPATFQEYSKAFGPRVGNQGVFVGNLRKCSTPMAFGRCLAGDAHAKKPQDCCSHVAVADLGANSILFTCTQTDECDSKAGCLGAIDCRGLYDHCVNGQCKTPVEGVDCGGEGQLPMKYGCCGDKIPDHDKKCTDRTSGGSCTKDSDCLGVSSGKASSCCNGACVQRAHCLD